MSRTTTDDRLDARSTTVIAVLLVSAFVVILNETAMNVALRDIMLELHVAEHVVQWLTTAFMLTMAVVIPITGWLIQRVPTRTLFILAMSLFSLGTLVAAIAPVFSILLAGRIVQASGTAIMMPLLMTTIMTLVPPGARGRVMGNVSIVISVAPAIGPTISGLILSFAHWRFVFVFVLPIAVLMLVIGALRITNVGENERTKLDVPSVLLSAVGFGGLVYGLTLIGSVTVDAWVPPTIVAGGIAALAVFALRQRVLQRTDEAFLDLRTFRYPAFTVSIVTMVLAMMALFGTVIVLPLLLQTSYGVDPLTVGLVLLPGGILMGLLGPLVGRLFDRFGPRVLIVPGSIVVAASFVLFATLQLTSPLWIVVVAHVLLSVGLAFMFTPLFTVSLGALPSSLYSHGSAIVGTVQQLAGAAGTALFVMLLVAFGQGVGGEAGTSATPEEFLAGARAAFLAAGGVWLLAIIAGAFVRQSSPDEVPDDASAAPTGEQPITTH